MCCSIGCKWCMAYAYILVCYVIPRALPSELHKHPRMYTYAIHHYNPCYNVYIKIVTGCQILAGNGAVSQHAVTCKHTV